MDEPTLDCSYCNRHGKVERQTQILDDDANWRTIHTTVLCGMHWEDLAVPSVERLQVHERLLVMPL